MQILKVIGFKELLIGFKTFGFLFPTNWKNNVIKHEDN